MAAARPLVVNQVDVTLHMYDGKTEKVKCDLQKSIADLKQTIEDNFDIPRTAQRILCDRTHLKKDSTNKRLMLYPFISYEIKGDKKLARSGIKENSDLFLRMRPIILIEVHQKPPPTPTKPTVGRPGFETEAKRRITDEILIALGHGRTSIVSLESILAPTITEATDSVIIENLFELFETKESPAVVGTANMKEPELRAYRPSTSRHPPLTQETIYKENEQYFFHWNDNLKQSVLQDSNFTEREKIQNIFVVSVDAFLLQIAVALHTQSKTEKILNVVWRTGPLSGAGDRVQNNYTIQTQILRDLLRHDEGMLYVTGQRALDIITECDEFLRKAADNWNPARNDTGFQRQKGTQLHDAARQALLSLAPVHGRESYEKKKKRMHKAREELIKRMAVLPDWQKCAPNSPMIVLWDNDSATDPSRHYGFSEQKLTDHGNRFAVWHGIAPEHVTSDMLMDPNHKIVNGHRWNPPPVPTQVTDACC